MGAEDPPNGRGTGRHARVPPAGFAIEESMLGAPMPPRPPRTDPVSAIQRWWALSTIVATLIGAGFIVSQTMNGYAKHESVEDVRAEVREVSDRLSEQERTAARMLEAQRHASDQQAAIAQRVDWLVQAEVEVARRQRRALLQSPPPPMPGYRYTVAPIADAGVAPQ